MAKGFFQKLISKRPSVGNIDQPQSEVQAASVVVPTAVQFVDEDIESELEEDVIGDDMLEVPNFNPGTQGRKSVSAEVYGEWNPRKNFVPPAYQRTEEEAKRIKTAVLGCFLFSSLDQESLETLVYAFEESTADLGDIIINQGDDGDKLYLIESGEVEVTKTTSNSETQFLCKLASGDIFGELALMYNAPRAATVKAITDLKLWALDRETFNNIVRDATIRKRDLYDGILQEVALLKDMDNYERSKISDALKPVKFLAGQTIITEGEPGETFYILVGGEAEAKKGGQSMMQYKKGDYFGELALLKDQPRAATVLAKTDCDTLSLNRRSFKRLLGPVESILIRNTENYKKIVEQLEGTK